MCVVCFCDLVAPTRCVRFKAVLDKGTQVPQCLICSTSMLTYVHMFICIAIVIIISAVVFMCISTFYVCNLIGFEALMSGSVCAFPLNILSRHLYSGVLLYLATHKPIELWLCTIRL